jgi:TatD DNase family protein
MEYIDIHSHLHFDRYDDDREEVLLRMKQAQVKTISIGIDSATSEEEVLLAEANESVYASIGLHPDDSHERFSEVHRVFEKLAKSNRVVAIGECGLDYSRIEGNLDQVKRFQRDNFEAQIAFAVERGLPVMIHSRDSVEDTLSILESKKREYGNRLRGNAHFFTQSVDIAKRYFEIGFNISFTGVITFAHDYDEVVRYAPLSMIHAETDAPFVAPIPYRGKRNEPTYVINVYNHIAHIRGEEREVVRRTLVSNAIRDFNLN